MSHNSFFSSFDSGFKLTMIIGIVMIVIFIAFFIIFTSTFTKITKQFRSAGKVNDNSPRLSVEASVVSKRSSVSAGRFTWNYATFQVESGDRIELSVPDSDFGMLVEGDYGTLTFQGARFISFRRNY